MADPIADNIRGVQQLVGSQLNKVEYDATSQQEGVADDFEDELTLKLDDEELLSLANQWENKYRGYEAKIKVRQESNKTYYLGRQKEGSATATVEGQPVSANLLFEAEETFLPAALSKNPEPVVWSDNTPQGNELSNEVKTMLQYHADTLALRRKLTLMTRHWSIYFLGIMKHGWDEEIKDITSEVRDPRDFILDPDGFVDCYADYEGPLGERITIPARKLIDLFPEHSAFIKMAVQDRLGTDVTYTEWWTDEFCFYTFKGKVLDKHKNPNFNYEKKQPEESDDLEETPKQPQEIRNHFARPKKPYTFLSVFSLGEQPHDVTGLIEQNIPNQRRVSQRTEQIDYNLKRSNNSDVFSANNFNQETAKQAANAMAKGNPILVPQGGPINEAIHRLAGQGVDASFFKELETSKEDLRSIFGTAGITSSAQNEDETARGMILKNQYDSTRIGGGIGDALEQVADNVFNWWVQLYYVYYDEPHFAAIMGQMKAVEYITLQARDMDRRLVVSVSPDSMKPHDELTTMNQAMQLWEAGAIDIKSLLTQLNFPDPQETAGQAWLYHTNPALYGQLNFPELQQEIQQLMAGQPPPGGQAPPGGAPSGAGQTPAQPPPSLGTAPAKASLSNVPIPK